MSYHIMSYHIMSYHIMSYHIMSYHIISINQSLEYSIYHIYQKEVLHHRISYDRRGKNGQEKLNLNGRNKRGFPVFKKEEERRAE